MKHIINIFLIFICSCSDNRQEYPHPDQFGGIDLYSELSNEELTMIGTWYFAYQRFIMQDGTDSISYSSGTSYMDINNPNQTDTLKFYTTKFVGFNWTCPFENPNKSNFVKLIRPQSGKFFDYCFPSGVGGWLIDDDNLTYYRGYDVDDFVSYPIDYMSSDSLVFIFKVWPEHNFKNIDIEQVVFYKEQ